MEDCKTVCKYTNTLRASMLPYKLQGASEGSEALDLISAYFEDEVGREFDASPMGSTEPIICRNTTDRRKLFPVLADTVERIVMESKQSEIWKQNALRKLRRFISEWTENYAHGQGDEPQRAETCPETMPESERTKSEQREMPSLPPELSTDEARKILDFAVSKGLLDEYYQPTKLTSTKPQMALLAEKLSERIGLDRKRREYIVTAWKPFEQLWGVEYLAQGRWRSKENGENARGKEPIVEAFRKTE